MESVMLVAPFAYDNEIRSRLATIGPVTTGAPGVLVMEDDRSRVYVSRNDAAYLEVEPESLGRVRSIMAEPVFYTVDFSDIKLCRRVLEAIADDPKLLIDDDHGLMLPGHEFVRILRARPEWDWRASPPDSNR